MCMSSNFFSYWLYVHLNQTLNSHQFSLVYIISIFCLPTYIVSIRADIYFSYPLRSDVEVLSGLNLTLECGKITALVGPSGAGKSTIVQLLARFYEVNIILVIEII